METVDLIAAGYEWDCPNCDWHNNEIEAKEQVTCSNCRQTFATNPPEHAHG